MTLPPRIRAHRTPRTPVRPAFDRGQTPRIACFSQAKHPLGVPIDTLLAALQEYVDQHVAPVWSTPAQLVHSSGYLKEHWAIVFLDESDEPGALAYHDLTPDGLPLSKVFVKTIRDGGGSLSVATSHELVEMLVDPAINLLALGPRKGYAYAYESADPVEEVAFPVRGLPMSDFVYPAYFEAFRAERSTQFDHVSKVTRPFQLLKGGYQILFKNGKWSEQFGSDARRRRFQREHHTDHRREQREAPFRRARAVRKGRGVILAGGSAT